MPLRLPMTNGCLHVKSVMVNDMDEPTTNLGQPLSTPAERGLGTGHRWYGRLSSDALRKVTSLCPNNRVALALLSLAALACESESTSAPAPTPNSCRTPEPPPRPCQPHGRGALLRRSQNSLWVYLVNEYDYITPKLTPLPLRRTRRLTIVGVEQAPTSHPDLYLP